MAVESLHMSRHPGISFRFDPREPPPPEFYSRGPHINHVNSAEYRVDTRDPYTAPVNGKSVSSLQSSEPIFLPPSGTSLKIQIINDTASIALEHVFNNPTATKMKKAHYQFPLPHESAITDFQCTIGNDIVLNGVAKPREQAQQIFDHEVANNRSAGLVQQDTNEIFKTSLGQIPPHARVVVNLSFILLLKHNFIAVDSVSSTTLSIPTFIAPRYGDAPVNILQTGPSTGTLSIEVDVLAADEIISIDSDSHEIAVDRGAKRQQCQRWADFIAASESLEQLPDPRAATARLAGDTAFLDKDFVLCIKSRLAMGREEPLACMEIHPSLPNHRAMMITLPTEFISRNLKINDSGEMVFLADCSGSMEDKLAGLRSAMERFIQGVPDSFSFNIWTFGSSYRSLWPRSRESSQSSKSEASAYVRTVNADMGGTELLPALQAIVSAWDRSKTIDIITVTDGEVWRHRETLDFVSVSRGNSEGRARFSALGIGNAVSHELVEGIAQAGGGYAEIIPAVKQDSWESRMDAVLAASLTGHGSSVHVELDNHAEAQVTTSPIQEPENTPPTVQRSPLDMSTLSPCNRLRIFYLFEGSSGPACKSVIIKIRRSTTGDEIRTTIPVRVLQNSDEKIHKFAVRALLGDLERGKSRVQQRPVPWTAAAKENVTREEGERLGCKWSLVSKWTSFVAIKEVATAIDGKQEVASPNVQKAADQDQLGLLRPRGPRQSRQQMPLLGFIDGGYGYDVDDFDDFNSDDEHSEEYTMEISTGSSRGPNPSVYFHHWSPRGNSNEPAAINRERASPCPPPPTGRLKSRVGKVTTRSSRIMMDSDSNVHLCLPPPIPDLQKPSRQACVFGILASQKADGSFVALALSYGIGQQAVTKLLKHLETVQAISGCPSRSVAITALVTALLELRFHDLLSTNWMWLGAVHKAKVFVGDAVVTCHDSIDELEQHLQLEDLWRLSKSLVVDITDNDLTVKEGLPVMVIPEEPQDTGHPDQSESEEPVEVLVAPVSESSSCEGPVKRKRS